ncbi:MAG TPA: c-type cytochrome [Puia sp.]|nr:c-type cytochrome [Puia sp.]
MRYRKILTSVLLAALVLLGVAAVNPPDPPKPKNLKILPKNITHEELDKVMDGFKDALGVKCNFCHAPEADSTSHHLDFASDAKPEKNIARKMMKMAAKINKKYFSYNTNDQGVHVDAVTCMTCHRGNPHPGEKH